MGRRFRFSLQPLLERNRRIEEDRRHAFAAAQRTLDDAREELQTLIHAVATHPYLDAAVAAQLCRIADLQAARESARQDFVAAARDRRVVEKLRERRLRAFESAAARSEELELDESNRSVTTAAFPKARCAGTGKYNG